MSLEGDQQPASERTSSHAIPVQRHAFDEASLDAFLETSFVHRQMTWGRTTDARDAVLLVEQSKRNIPPSLGEGPCTTTPYAVDPKVPFIVSAVVPKRKIVTPGGEPVCGITGGDARTPLRRIVTPDGDFEGMELLRPFDNNVQTARIRQYRTATVSCIARADGELTMEVTTSPLTLPHAADGTPESMSLTFLLWRMHEDFARALTPTAELTVIEELLAHESRLKEPFAAFQIQIDPIESGDHVSM